MHAAATRRRKSLTLGTALLLMAAVAYAGCKVPPSKLDPKDLETAQDEALDVLRKLFPDLSKDDLDEISASLSLKEVLDLEAELDAIRKDVAKFSADLFKSAQDRVKERRTDLASHNDGFPVGLEVVGRVCSYDAETEHAEVRVSGVFDGKESVRLDASNVSLSIDGKAQAFTLSCLPDGDSVDVVFLIDVTGSMSNVIHAVRDSVVDFIDVIESSGLHGTVSVVSFQDSVGVNTTFQEPAPANDFERSPFLPPVDLADAPKIQGLRDFVNKLEANRGEDAPENLAGAIDFARNNVIGYTSDGKPNVIGDHHEDPLGTSPFPKLRSDRQVFVVLTDVGFHGDNQDQTNSSLRAEFVPRNAAEILASLNQTGTTVHVSDPSWADASTDPKQDYVDADYWSMHTGGVGEDKVAGYSLVDLELVVVAERTGLLDITLDKILESSCTLSFDAKLSAKADVELGLEVGGKKLETRVDVELE